MDASMIHKSRALFRKLTEDDDFLYKQKLIDLFLHDSSTQKSLQNISGFLFHALNTEGTFETALNRMKTRTSGRLTMEEFMAFLNTASLNMAKGHTPNTADLLSRPENQSVEQQNDQQRQVNIMNATSSTIDSNIVQQDYTKMKMMSSMDLRTLLRPKTSTGTRSSMKRVPKHLKEPSPFSIEGSVVLNKRRKRPSTAHTRPLKVTAYGTPSIEHSSSYFESDSSLISSSSIIHTTKRNSNRRIRRPQSSNSSVRRRNSPSSSASSSTRRRPQTAASGNNSQHGMTNKRSFTHSTTTTAAEMINLQNSSLMDNSNEAISSNTAVGGVMAGGSAMSVEELHHAGSSIVEEFEWNRSQQYLNGGVM